MPRRMARDVPMGAPTALAFFYVLWLAPRAHVMRSPRSGPPLPPPGTRCPFGPRPGWLVIVLMLGALGWLMFWNARYRRPRAAR